MNTEVLFRKLAGIRSREGYLPTIGVQAVYRGMVAGLWLALAMMASGLVFSYEATAQDASWQDQPQPKRRARPAAQAYPDEQLPDRTVAMNDDTVLPTAPLVPDGVDSPSNEPPKRKKAKPAGDAGDADGGEARPTRSVPPLPRHPKAAEENMAETEEPFASPEEGCEENDFGYTGPPLRGILANRLWFRGEALLWWLKGGETPPLLTTSPASTSQAQAGVLDSATTTVLFGNDEMNTGLHAGGRMTFGLWLDRCQESGLEFSYFVLGENQQSYSNPSNPVLARPFFNVTTGSEDRVLLAYPGAATGTFSASSTENFQGAEALWRRAIVHGDDGRIDFIAGYRFQRLTDGLTIGDSVTGGTPSATITNADEFHTCNDFNGGEIGFATQWHRNRWSLDTLLKMGIGETNTQVYINGWTTVATTPPILYSNAGMLALESNSGTHTSQQFSVMPEIGLTLGYDLTPRLKASVGYTLLYWTNVARPGDQIDLNVDPRQFAPPTQESRPQFVLHTSDFWAQGVNLGLDYRF